MTWSDSFVDLLAICGDSPSREHRGRAARLLATELVARLNLTPRDHNPDLRRLPTETGGQTTDLAPMPTHFAWRDLESEDPGGGSRQANLYMRWSLQDRHSFPGLGTVPKTPATQGEYDLTVVAVILAADELVTDAQPFMVTPTFNESRATYLASLQTYYPDLYP